MNLYAYVGNDSINGRDPNGTNCVPTDADTKQFCITIRRSGREGQLVDTNYGPINGTRANAIEAKVGYQAQGSSETWQALAEAPVGSVLSAYSARSGAESDTVSIYRDNSGHNDASDGFRHTDASIRLTQSQGAEIAQKFGDAHERSNTAAGQARGELLMDLMNNNNGRILAQIFPGADPKTLAQQAMATGLVQARPFIILQNTMRPK